MLRVSRLRVERLRILSALELEDLGDRVWLVGPNGAGKTSVLEALFLLGHGRSFRAGGLGSVVQSGARELSVFAELERGDDRHRLGLRRRVGEWEARLDGCAVSSLVDLFRRLPVLVFDPESHSLVAGPGDERRRYLDWGLFHVEREFLSTWRRFQRALQQRNVLLKHGQRDEMAAWNRELGEWGQALDHLRRRQVASLVEHVHAVAGLLAPELGATAVSYQPGWRSEGLSLAEALAASEARDLQVGHTTVGPHRADLLVRFERLDAREHLSRGQQKLVALVLKLAQGALHAERLGSWPVLLMDDLGSELDAIHHARCLSHLAGLPAQCWLTATHAPPDRSAGDSSLFHVEQGRATRLL